MENDMDDLSSLLFSSCVPYASLVPYNLLCFYLGWWIHADGYFCSSYSYSVTFIIRSLVSKDVVLQSLKQYFCRMVSFRNSYIFYSAGIVGTTLNMLFIISRNRVCSISCLTWNVMDIEGENPAHFT